MNIRKKVFALLTVCLLTASLPLAVLAAEQSGQAGQIGMEAAKKIALDHAGAAAANVTFTKVKLDYDHGIAEYEIKFTWNETRYDYEVDAASGEITGYSHKAQKTRRQSRAADSAGYIGIDKAKEIALTHAGVSAGQARFTKAKLDRDRKGRGRAKYDIEFYVNGTEHEFEINASTGKVIEYSVENYD